MIYSMLVLCALAEPMESEGADQLRLANLSVGQRIEIVTTRRHYRAKLVDPKTGEALASVSTDGQRYGPPTKIYLLGATVGRYPETLVTMGQLRLGLRIEMGLGSLAAADRALTQPVTALRLVEP